MKKRKRKTQKNRKRHKKLRKGVDKSGKKEYNKEVGMERWLSWSKAHDWKSCVRLITDRGFESLSLRQYLETPIFCGKSTIYTQDIGVPCSCFTPIYTGFDWFCDILCYIESPEIRLKGIHFGCPFFFFFKIFRKYEKLKQTPQKLKQMGLFLCLLRL